MEILESKYLKVKAGLVKHGQCLIEIPLDDIFSVPAIFTRIATEIDKGELDLGIDDIVKDEGIRIDIWADISREDKHII